MLKMRLQRIGRKNDAAFRVIVTDSRSGPKSGRHIDLLGSYNPKLDHVSIDGIKAKEWIAKGVQVSPTVHNLLVGKGIVEGTKINVLPRKSPIVKEKTDEESPQAVPPQEKGGLSEQAEEEESGKISPPDDASQAEVLAEMAVKAEEREEEVSLTEESPESSKETEAAEISKDSTLSKGDMNGEDEEKKEA